MTCSRTGPFGPLKISKELLHHVADYKRDDGRILKVCRLLDPDDGPIYTEDPMDTLFHIGDVKIQPMKQPSSLVFYSNYQYGKG